MEDLDWRWRSWAWGRRVLKYLQSTHQPTKSCNKCSRLEYRWKWEEGTLKIGFKTRGLHKMREMAEMWVLYPCRNSGPVTAPVDPPHNWREYLGPVMAPVDPPHSWRRFLFPHSGPVLVPVDQHQSWRQFLSKHPSGAKTTPMLRYFPWFDALLILSNTFTLNKVKTD